jgi:hypothetical protein
VLLGLNLGGSLEDDLQSMTDAESGALAKLADLDILDRGGTD